MKERERVGEKRRQKMAEKKKRFTDWCVYTMIGERRFGNIRYVGLERKSMRQRENK